MKRAGWVIGVLLGIAAGCGGDEFDDVTAGEAGASGEGGAGGGGAGEAGTTDGGAGQGGKGQGGQGQGGKEQGSAATCPTGSADCDKNAGNGCEVDLTSDDANCGACGKACTGGAHTGASCEASVCKQTCDTGYDDCDEDFANGCEADLKGDPSTCGKCAPCAQYPNEVPSCAAGQCEYACQADYADCNGELPDGCEKHLPDDVANCGSCGHVCGAQHATASCEAGKCEIVCEAGHANCDGIDENGCETDLTGNTNCGACGHDCKAGQCNGSMMCDPILLGETNTAGSMLTMDSSTLYWKSYDSITSHFAVVKLSKGGGTVGTVGYPSGDDFGGMAPGDDGIFLSMNWNGALYLLEFSSEQLATKSVPTGVQYGHDVVRTSQWVFWVASGGGTQKLFRAPHAGGSPTLVWSEAVIQSVAADDQSVYWANNSKGEIRSVSHNGTDAKTVGLGAVGATSLTHHGTKLYWATGNGGTVLSVDKGGGTPTVLVPNGGTPVWGATSDAGHVWYWSGNEIRRVPNTGGTPMTMAVGQKDFSGMVSDGEYLYWLSMSNDVTKAYKIAAGP